jgi:hypothetical protein
MYQDNFSDNSAKKKMIQNWMTKFQEDKSDKKVHSALTIGDAKSFESLLDITEEIETQSELLLADFDKSEIETGQLRIDAKSNEIISRLYRDVKKGLAVLIRTNFKGLPESDISKLEVYSDSLSEYFDAFDAKKDKIIQENRRNPINPGRTVPVYEAEMQVKIETINEIQDALDAKDEEKQAHLYENPIRDEDGVLKPMAVRDGIKQHTAELDREIAEIQRDLRRETAGIPEIQKNIDNARQLGNKELGKIVKIKSSRIDFNLILKNYEIFVDTLHNGLLAHKTGYTGKINKVTEEVINLGAGCGGEMPMRRFL